MFIFNIVFPTLTLCVGFFVGYKLNKGFNVQIKPDNPVRYINKKIKEHKDKKQVNEQIEQLNDIMDNLENYDGTALNQKEVKHIENFIL